MNILKDLQPASVFHFFEEICRIPHTSFHEKALSDYCVAFAKDHGLYWEQDDLGNVLIISKASEGYEDSAPLMIQGHLDMVGDKTLDCPLNLETDGLELEVSGDWISAKGTTLGGDDGIAVAYALAALDDNTLLHPRLEVILTVSEEVGLLGASAIDLSSCQAKRLLNMDSEEEGIFTVGCAGGRRAQCDLPMTRETAAGLQVNFAFAGILGGHSGIEINKGLANANRLAGRFLLSLKNQISFGILSLEGGVKENVIPKDANFSLLIQEQDLDKAVSVLDRFQQQISLEYASADPNIRLTMETGSVITGSVLTETSKERLLTALNLMPNGVQSMNQDLEGLVETSLNLGVVQLTKDNLQLCFSLRSSVTSAKEYLYGTLKQFTEYLGGQISYNGDYPAWPFARESKFRDLCVQCYEEQYGEKPQIVTIHAGLECGIFSEKVPGLECVSIGPNMKDIHTVKERLSISSTERVWKLIKSIISAK